MFGKSNRTRLSFWLGAAMVTLASLSTLGCSEDTDEPKDEENGAKTDTLQGLPEDVKAFADWTRLNAAPIPEKEDVPHKGTKNVYTNKSRTDIAPDGQQVFPYPDGTIVVKAITPIGGNFVNAVGVMRKVAGSDPEHNDWKWIKYARDTETAPFTVVGENEMCWGCHAGAIQQDYVFTVLE